MYVFHLRMVKRCGKCYKMAMIINIIIIIRVRAANLVLLVISCSPFGIS